MDELDVFALTCAGCAARFVVCRPDYRGQSYCGDECREYGRAAIRRLASAKHQRSDEGRRDHAVHQSELVARKHAESRAMTDVRREEVAPRAECSAPDTSLLLVTTTSTVVIAGEDTDAIHGGHHPVADEDARALDPGRRRAAARDLAAALVGASRALGDRVLQGLSLWLDAKLRVVLSVDERAAGFCLALTDEMGLGMRSVYFDVEVHDSRARRRGRRIRGIGDFTDLRQLYLRRLGPDES